MKVPISCCQYVSDIDKSMLTEMVVIKIDREDLLAIVVASFITREEGADNMLDYHWSTFNHGCRQTSLQTLP